MTEHYRHLQAEDRVILYELINQGCAIQDIANVIGCHKTTIYRELHRKVVNRVIALTWRISNTGSVSMIKE